MIKLLTLLLFISTQITKADLVDFSHSGTEYFRMFNYNSTENHQKLIEMEYSMINTSKNIIEYIQANPDYQSTSRKYTSRDQLAMFLVYTGMLIMNNNNGGIEKIIPKSVLESKMALSIKERYELSEYFLKFARKISPDNERITAWHSSNMLRMQKYVNGVVDDEVLDWIIEMTKENPVFHLFNALTMNSDYSFGPEREQVIFEMVELMNSTDSPCFPPIKFLRRGEAKKCNTTKKTPYAMQGTSVYMGDVYLKKVIDNPDSDMNQEYLKKALSIYKRPKLFKPLRTRKWNLKNNLNERIHMVKQMENGQMINADFFKSRNYLDIYTCTSCHQDGKAKKSLFINLP